jgi:hypothetical protein
MNCDDTKQLSITMGSTATSFDIRALLVTIYCHRALAIGEDPQRALEEYWPHDAPWNSGQ